MITREELRDRLDKLKGLIDTEDRHDVREVAEAEVLAEFDRLEKEIARLKVSLQHEVERVEWLEQENERLERTVATGEEQNADLWKRLYTLSDLFNHLGGLKAESDRKAERICEPLKDGMSESESVVEQQIGEVIKRIRDYLASMAEGEKPKLAIDLEKITSVKCVCGHELIYHYYAEGCCDRSKCECKQFRQQKPIDYSKYEEEECPEQPTAEERLREILDNHWRREWPWLQRIQLAKDILEEFQLKGE